jgi:hypothetical protein
MQILKMHNLTQNYRINLAARGILQSHGTLRHMTDESNNGIQERDPRGVRMQLANPVLGGYCCLRDGPSRQRNTPGDHGTLPMRRTYALLENDGPLRGQPSSRGHKLKEFAVLIICRLMRTADIGTKYQRIGNIHVHMVIM